MKVVVCVKFVPDLQAERRFSDDFTVERGAEESVLNELDENAIEFAVSTVEHHGGEVIVLTVGPDDAEAAVRKGLQMGADRGVHVCDDAVHGSDVFGTAAVLAAAIRHIAESTGDDGAQAPVDLVVTGMAALDSLTSLLPTVLAADLGWPQATLAAQIDVGDGVVTVTRSLDAAVEVVEAPLPAVVSVTDQANDPRYPNFKAIMAAKKKPVESLTLADLGVDPASVGFAGSWSEVVEAVPAPARAQGVIVHDDGQAGTRLADYLADNKLI